MLRYGFFDSEIVGFDEEGMPIFDRAESSDFLAMFISRIIGNGVLAAPGDCFQIVAGEGMVLKVRPGFGIVQGKFAADTKESEIEIPKAHTSYKRIDRVVLRVNYLQRLCEIIVKTGTPDATPVPSELLQPASGDYYELCLATVAVNSNQTVITQANITDTRYDSAVCGVVTQLIDHLDTSVFFAQLNSFYDEYVARFDGEYTDFKTRMQTAYNEYEHNLSLFFMQFQTEKEEAFNEWFDLVKGQFDGDVGARIMKSLDELEKCIQNLDDHVAEYESNDIENPTEWTDVSILKNEETHKSIFNKVSTMFKNIRFIWNLLYALSANGLITEVQIVNKLPSDAASHPTTFYWVKE